MSRRTFSLALLLAASPLPAQFNLGRITGSVFDPNGGAVAGCAVKVVSLANLSARGVLTNSVGGYTVPSLPADAYELTVEAPGFQKMTARVTVGVDQTVAADFQLKLGNVSEQVEVSAQASEVQVQKDSHEIQRVVATQDLQNLPASGRSFLSLAAAGPGAQRASDSAGQPGPLFTFGMSGHAIVLAGQTLGSTTFLQDGVLNMNMMTQTANIVPSIESIQEVSVESSGMSARFPAPGLVNVISKHGSNAIHGTVYDYLQNDSLNARNFFAASRPPLRYNQFGANLGAPILKNRLFAFFDYAGQRQTSAAVSRQRVPTPEERQGNFQSTTIYDPATFSAATGAIAAFPGNVIPANRVNPFATRYLGYIPAPNGPLSGGINYIANLTNPAPYDQYVGRLDYNLSSKDTLYGQIQTSDSPLLAPTIVTGLFGLETKNSGTNASLQDIHVFTANLVNIARVGYNRNVLFVTPQGLGAEDYVKSFGLRNLPLPADQLVPPSVTISGALALGSPTYPQGSKQNLFQFADEVNWTHGRHQIFFGGETNRIQFNSVWQNYNGGGFTFNGQYVSNHLTGSALKLGPGLADFLLGYPSSAMGAQGLGTVAFRETDVAGYLQDTWKVSPKLTVNLGLRYQFYQPPSDRWGKASRYDLPTNTRNPGAWDPNYHNFGPRVGFAYALSAKTVIRSGFGIYYNSNPFQYLRPLAENLSKLITLTENINTPVAVTDVFPANATASATTPSYLTARQPTPYTEQWNFSLQHAFHTRLLATLAYVGNASHFQSLRYSPNQAIQDVDPTRPTAIQSRRPYSFIGDVIGQNNIANATYHGLQSTVQTRFSHGFSLLGTYTWSKALTLTDTGATVAVNGLDAKGSSYGPANFSRTHVFTASYVYELPFGSGKPFLGHLGWASKQVLGGWQISGITVAETGSSFQVTATDTSNTGGIHTQVANRLCNGNLSGGQRSIQRWFDTSCFVQPSAGRLGNEGRNPLKGPGTVNFDLSAFKRFPFGEHRWVQFRTDFFSAFNHAQFSTGATQPLTASTYGQAVSAVGSRIVQMSLQVSF